MRLDRVRPTPHPLAMTRRYTSFAEFWPFYLREHSKASTRAAHYVGTSLVVLIAIIAALTGRLGPELERAGVARQNRSE